MYCNYTTKYYIHVCTLYIHCTCTLLCNYNVCLCGLCIWLSGWVTLSFFSSCFLKANVLVLLYTYLQGSTCESHALYIHVHVYKVTALGVLCCFALFVCLTLLASFFLPSHLSFSNAGIF